MLMFQNVLSSFHAHYMFNLVSIKDFNAYMLTSYAASLSKKLAWAHFQCSHTVYGFLSKKK